MSARIACLGQVAQLPSRRTLPVPAVCSRVLILFLVALALAGCGKKGEPQPPPGEPNTYPRIYPSA